MGLKSGHVGHDSGKVKAAGWWSASSARLLGHLMQAAPHVELRHHGVKRKTGTLQKGFCFFLDVGAGHAGEVIIVGLRHNAVEEVIDAEGVGGYTGGKDADEIVCFG